MRYIAAEDIAKAKEMDLLTYLRNYEPQELVHVSGNTYCTREHDSLRISNGKWCWFSQGIGGRSALDYTQLFQQLYYQADSVHGGRLPVHVHFVMDEFANVALPDEFDKLLSTMRSREISVSIIIQNLAQLKALFEKQWESIVGNCDEFLYLGGNEQSTHEYVSKLLGKETIDTNTYGRSRGRNGSYSTNYQLAGRELMTPDEVRMLDNQYALLFIRGERPIRDLKYDILHHPNVALTTDGSAPAYTHGEDTRSIASMAFSFDKKAVKNAEKLEAEKHEFLLYSEEELEELLDEKEKKDNEET